MIDLKASRKASELTQMYVVERMRERGHKWYQTTITRIESGKQPLTALQEEDLCEILPFVVGKPSVPSQPLELIGDGIVLRAFASGEKVMCGIWKEETALTCFVLDEGGARALCDWLNASLPDGVSA